MKFHLYPELKAFAIDKSRGPLLYSGGMTGPLNSKENRLLAS